jgi:hypothetical protein
MDKPQLSELARQLAAMFDELPEHEREGTWHALVALMRPGTSPLPYPGLNASTDDAEPLH